MNLNQFQRAANLSAGLAARWFPPLTDTMVEFEINTPKRQAAFIAQIGCESAGFSTLAESFNYSIQGLKDTFAGRLSAYQCEMLGRSGDRAAQQTAIANLVYQGRYGNKAPGDGWKFRGRGLKQVTFLDNYRQCGNALGIDLVANPDLLLVDKYAARSAGWFWQWHNLNQYADNGDFNQMTKVINGGTNGLSDRRSRLKIAEGALL